MGIQWLLWSTLCNTVGYKNGDLVRNISEDKVLDPGGRNDVTWCIVQRASRRKVEDVYGKWLVFRDCDRLSETWTNIVMALREGKLEDCCEVKSSTLWYHPSCAGPGPSTSGVICVYTCKDDMESIGYKLIQMVKQDIKYKTDEDTRNYKYSHVGEVATIKTLYYNQGHPSPELTGERCFGTTRNKEDIWHINEIVSPVMHTLGAECGRWILTFKYEKLTHFWHLLKGKIENGQMKAIKMVCPPKRKRSSRNEKPVFHVYTNEEHVKSVGSLLILEVCHDIQYEKKNGYPHYRTLYWNEGEYAYEKITRKRITRNWRTGDTV